MSNIGEAQITRLTRERLAAIKKFLPVRDSFRDNLQAQQQAKMGFTSDTQQLFAPIITAKKKVVTAITAQPDILPTLQQITAVGKETQQGIKQLSSDIKNQREYGRLADIDVTGPQPVQPAIADIQPKEKKNI